MASPLVTTTIDRDDAALAKLMGIIIQGNFDERVSLKLTLATHLDSTNDSPAEDKARNFERFQLIVLGALLGLDWRFSDDRGALNALSDANKTRWDLHLEADRNGSKEQAA